MTVARPEPRRPQGSPLVNPTVLAARKREVQRHSPGPDQLNNDEISTAWELEPGQATTRIPASATSILRFDETVRVSQPGEGRQGEQGQISSGRVIPNQAASAAPRIQGPPAVITEVKRKLKRRISPPRASTHRSGNKRLVKEAQEIGYLPNGCHAAPKADDLFQWAAVLEGPKGTVYEGGTFFCTIHIPCDYPFNPPKVTFHTRIYHCNVNAQGEVCLDILKDKWCPTMCISTVLNALLDLMRNCNSDAMVCPIGRQFKENREEFDKKARQWTERYACL